MRVSLQSLFFYTNKKIIQIIYDCTVYIDLISYKCFARATQLLHKYWATVLFVG